jgi:Flp pilus assembly protein TadG
MIETAIVAILALMFLFGIFEYGRFLMVRNLVDNAVQSGARYAVVNTSDVTTTDIQNRVDQMLAGQSVHLQGYNKTTSIQVYWADANGNNVGSWTDAAFGSYIAVRIDSSYRPMLPNLLFMNTTIPVRAVSQMYSEAN